MDDRASDKALMTVYSEAGRTANRLGLAPNITAVTDMYGVCAEKMKRRNLKYLTLPSVLQVIAEQPFYGEALCWGRGAYYDELHDFDERTEQLTHVPLFYSREEIGEQIQSLLFVDGNMRLATDIPLYWRVGFIVGWLSGLAVSQQDDVQAAMVMLSALVVPLLVVVPNDERKNQCLNGEAKQLETKQSRPNRRFRRLNAKSKRGVL